MSTTTETQEELHEPAHLPNLHLSKQQLYLLGDIGGTNVRLELRNGENELMHRMDKRTSLFASLSEALKEFFSHYAIDHKNILACLSIAGKILDNRVVACDNIPWPLSDGNEIQKEFGIFS